jgi:multicomponent Na+:H+ antiporter subunit D
MVAGSLVAIYQANIKRMLAYSSVAQVGYMVLGVSLVSVTGLTAALLHMFNHALMKAALFMALGVVAYQVGSVRIEAFRGLGRRMPWTMAAFALAGVSLIGLPPTAGFVSKWYLISSAVEAGHPALVVLIVLTSMMALIYIWRVVEAAWFRETTEPASASANEAPLRLLIPVWLLVAANFWFGIDTRLNVGAANAAAQALMSGIPGASP